MVSPNSILTNQVASDYDDKGSEVISPQIADIKPVYAVVDQEQETQTVKIGVQLKNNYASTTSEIQLLGKIPFEGNTYVINGADLGSTFTTKMTNEGIVLPEELKEIATVYYSENENPDRDLSKQENGWKTAGEVTNWDNVKTYLIDLGNYVMPTGKEFVFNYVVEIPNGLAFNEVAYSHHAIYFCLDTDEGKYRTETEPNKLGLRIAEKYNLELTKYQKDKDKLVQGATYRITDEETGESKTGVTNAEGKLGISNLYAEKAYIIQEIKTPDDYELNSNIIRFIGHVDEEGNLSIERTEGFIKGDMTVTKVDGEKYKVNVEVEDEVKASIKITKKEEGTETLLKGVRFKLTGYGLSENGKSVTTNANGEATLKGLSVNQEYTLEELKAEGYYLASPIKFKVVNNDGNYTIEKIEDETATGEIAEQTTIEDDGIPTINVTLDNEKIPTYDLEVIKIKRTTPVEEGENGEGTEETTYLEGAKFRLYKGTEELGEYITDSEGKLTITGLYQYESDKNIDQTYTLKEVVAPAGYAKVKDIRFKAEVVNGSLILKEIDENGEESDSSRFTTEGNTIKLTIEDSPSFKLIKKDAETQEVLAGVKFAFYNVDNGEMPATNSKGEIIGTQETIDGKEYYTVTTDTKGELTLDLPEGLYKAVEVQASDEKYDISEATYYFGIGGSREAVKNIKASYGKAIGGSDDDRVYSIKATKDGGCIIGGSYEDEIDLGNGITLNGSYPGFIAKYDAQLNCEWAKSIGTSSFNYIYTVIETSDGGYLAGGQKDTAYLIKLDENGNTEWEKVLGNTYRDSVNCVIQTKDGGYVIVGKFKNSSLNLGNGIILDNHSDTYDGMVIKYDNEGNCKWAKAIGGSESDVLNTVTELNNGDIILGGTFSSDIVELENGIELKKNSNSIRNDGMIIRYDSEGNYKFSRSMEETDIISIDATNYNGYVIGGSYDGELSLDNGITLNGDSSGIVVKFDENNKGEWAKSIDNDGIIDIESIVSLNEGGYIVAVESDTGTRNGILIKYDENGCIEYKMGYNYSFIYSVDENVDNEIIIGGCFSGSTINLGNQIILNNHKDSEYLNTGSYDGIIAKFSQTDASTMQTTMHSVIGGDEYSDINTVLESKDGGYIVGGSFEGNMTLKNGITYNSDSGDGIIIKYDKQNNIEWVNTVVGNYSEYVENIIQTKDESYVVTLYSCSTQIKIGDEYITNGKYGFDVGLVIKYDKDGNLIWVKKISEPDKNTSIEYVTEMNDGGIVVGGYFVGTIEFENKTVISNCGDGIIIKYDKDGNTEWVKTINSEGQSSNWINAVEATKDGGVVVAEYVQDGPMNIDGNIIETNRQSTLLVKYNQYGECQWIEKIDATINDILCTKDGNIIAGGRSENGNLFEYDENGNLIWKKQVAESIYSISNTMDGGFIIGGRYKDTVTFENGSSLTVYGDYDGMIIKYNASGNYEWSQSISGDDYDLVNSVVETSTGEYLIGGEFWSSTIELDNNKILVNNAKEGTSNGFVLKAKVYFGVPEVQELTIENERKQFKITTNVKEIDGIKGGSISGEDNNPYEAVKYGDSSTKEIIMTPDENYEIIGITVNGQEWQFKENTDGTYTMPQFDNVIEDKHVEVTYALKDNKLTINKVDSKTQEPLQGATFKLDQIEERTDPENVIGGIVANGTEYIEVDSEQGEVTGVIGELTNNGTYYFVKNDDGALTPTNSKTYQIANGGSSGKQNTTANSYVELDLSNLEGQYIAVVNANVSSQSGYDYGYATISQNTSAPSYSTNNSTSTRFMYISGTSTTSTTPRDFESKVLEGGNIYYLHLGYRKSSSTDTGNDQVVINNIKVYKVNVSTYNFVDNQEGGYESNNQGVNNTTANSYIPIDLTEYTGKYNLIVNAQVSSQSSNDYGYATVTTTTSAPAHNNSTGRFIYKSGTSSSSITPKDYTTVLQGGQMYYLHLGYYKNSSTSSGEDKFTVNSIKITPNDSELYHTEVTTNSEGQAITQIPFGKYQITEIEAPEGYQLLETPIEIEFRADGNHEVTISNMEKAKVVVHHYLKTAEGEYTTKKVADDELLEGKIDETYVTSPHLDIEKYQLEEDAEGNYVIPANATGTYESGIQEVTYYYEEKDIPLIVHHYIEGTETPVLLENGEQAKNEKYEGKENEEYTTKAISQEELDEKYELVEVPSNATGVYTPTETVVTYYYRLKDSAGVIVHHIDTETKEKIAPDVIIPAEGTGKYGDSYITEVSEEIPANYEYVTRTDNWEGTMIDELTEVTYEYKKVEPNIIDEQIEKTATQAIENPSAEIGYKIKYTTQVENYIGKAQITIEDELPYTIDTTKSELAGGTYNEANNTITWVEVVEGIDTYTQVESGKIEVNKTIKVVYKNVDDRNTEIENRVNGRLKLLTPEKTSEGVTTTAETVIKSVVNIPVSKVWEDDSDKLGKRPTRVVFKLTGSDGSEYTKELAKPGTQGSTTTQDSTNPNKWNDIFGNLPKYDVNKQEIVYTLTEINGDLTYYDASLDSTGRIVTNTSKYGKVTVHYYIMNPDGSLTTTRVPDAQGQDVQDAVIEGKEGNPYATEEATNVSEKYELVEEKLPENAEGTIEKYNEEKPQEVIYYYRLKPAKVLINYLEKDGDSDDSNNQVLTAQERIDGHVDDSYNTDTEHRKETITKDGKTYTLVEDSKNTEGAMTVEDINVTYYYLQNTKATVRYVERDPETHEIVKDLEEPYTQEGLVGDEFVTYSKKFDGYKLVESPEQTTINMTKEEQTLIYYYEPVYTGLIENHIDDKTGKILYTETHDISVGESYNIPSKEFAGYDLIESKLPENSIGIMEEEELVIVNYYYIKKAVLEVNYIDRETGKPLAEQIIDETKHEGDSYTTEEKTFNEYDMVQLEGNQEGTMVVETDEEGNITNNRTVVTYYYAKKSVGVEEHHIDIRTGEELEKPTLHEGHIGDEYNIPSKNFLSYVVATTDKDGNNMLPTNAKGKMTAEKQVVNYYYNQPAKVIVYYVEKATGKELEEANPETGELQNSQVVIEGQKDDDYATTAKEFEYYTLIEKPEEEQGKMKVEIVKDENGNDVVNNTIELYYYYEAKPFNIGVEKEITGIIVNGERRDPTSGKLEKVEIYRKATEDTSVQVEYKIKVMNTGEISGNATIEENIPAGMSLANNDGTWEEQEGKLIKVIPELGAGETKEYTVLLNWEQTGENMGEKANEVKLVETGNVPGFVDNNDKDNTSNANVIISVETGELPIGLILALVALVGLETITLRYAMVLTKKQKKKVNKK